MAKDDSSLDDLEWVAVPTSRPVDGSISQLERAKLKFGENPFIPIGLVATTLFLAFGLRAMKRGDRAQSQIMMRGRVLAQGFTVAALLVAFAAQTTASLKKRKAERDQE